MTPWSRHGQTQRQGSPGLLFFEYFLLLCPEIALAEFTTAGLFHGVSLAD